MKVLFVSPSPRSRHQTGGEVYSQTVIEMLGHAPLNADVEHLAPRNHVQRFGGVIRRLSWRSSLAGSLVSPLPAKALHHYSPLLARRVREKLMAEKFDLVILNGSELLWILPKLPPGPPKILIVHAIESQLSRSIHDSRQRFNGPLRSLLVREDNKLERYEFDGMRAVRNMICISSGEAQVMRDLDHETRILHIPPVFSYRPHERSVPAADTTRLEIGCLGAMNWWPNREGVEWFIDKVLARVEAPVRLHIYGYGGDKLTVRDARVVVHGFVERLEEVWETCDFMICPIFSGAGANVKFAEALYNGLPVLSTTFGARGLALPPHPGIVLLDSDADWIEFLNSSAAFDLRNQSVPTGISNTFAMSGHATALHDFILKIVD